MNGTWILTKTILRGSGTWSLYTDSYKNGIYPLFKGVTNLEMRYYGTRKNWTFRYY